MKKILLLITLSTLLFSSCQKKGTPEPVSGEVTFNFSHKESYTRAEPEVKEGEISDINIFLYDETGRLSQWKYSDQVENSITLEFDTEREYSIYVLANVGDLTSDRAVSTVNGICGLYASFNDISSIVNQSGGIPMAAYIPQGKLSDGDTRTISLVRLLSKFRIIIDKSGLSPSVTNPNHIIGKTLVKIQNNNRQKRTITISHKIRHQGSQAEKHKQKSLLLLRQQSIIC